MLVDDDGDGEGDGEGEGEGDAEGEVSMTHIAVIKSWTYNLLLRLCVDHLA